MKHSIAVTLFGKSCVLVALLLSGCSKENEPALAKPACRIIKSDFATGTTNLVSQYTYDAEDRIKEMVASLGTRKTNSVSYEYNQQGLLSKQIAQEYIYDAQSNQKVTSRAFTLTYNEKGQVSQYQSTVTSADPATPQATWVSLCEYDDQGNRTKITTSGSNSAPIVNVFEYKDGNCIKATYLVGDPTEFSIAYEYYLDRENKSRTLAYVSLFSTSGNKNMVKKTIETYKSSPSSNMVIEYSYEFNNQGFPVKTTAVSGYNNGSPSTTVTTSEYACQ